MVKWGALLFWRAQYPWIPWREVETQKSSVGYQLPSFRVALSHLLSLFPNTSAALNLWKKKVIVCVGVGLHFSFTDYNDLSCSSSETRKENKRETVPKPKDDLDLHHHNRTQRLTHGCKETKPVHVSVAMCWFPSILNAVYIFIHMCMLTFNWVLRICNLLLVIDKIIWKFVIITYGSVTDV